MASTDPVSGWLERLTAQSQAARAAITQASQLPSLRDVIPAIPTPQPTSTEPAAPSESWRGAPSGGGPTNVDGLGVSPAEAWIIQHESGGRTSAYNPKAVISNGHNLGHAFGLGQLVDTNRQNLAHILGITNPNTTDPGQQLALMRAYIKGRYGSAEQAMAFWKVHGWY